MPPAADPIRRGWTPKTGQGGICPWAMQARNSTKYILESQTQK